MARREAVSGEKGGKPQARATCRDYKQMLGEMLEWAIARRYITWNPARIAKLPKDRSTTDPDAPSVYKRSKAKESFTREQYASLMAVLTSTDDDEFRIATPNAYFLAEHRGTPGEMDALRWEQVDFDNRTITLDHAIKCADGGRPLGIGPTKTGSRHALDRTLCRAARLPRLEARDIRLRPAVAAVRERGLWLLDRRERVRQALDCRPPWVDRPLSILLMSP